MKAKFDFDISFQGALVRLLFQQPTFAEVALDHISPAQFDNPRHAWVVGVMKHHLRVNDRFTDQVVLFREAQKAAKLGTIPPAALPKYKRYILEALAKPVPNQRYVKEELQSFVRVQAIREFVLETAETLLPRGRFDVIQRRMLDIVDLNLQAAEDLPTSPASGVERRIKSREDLSEDAITTGLPDLDRLMKDGGLAPRQLAVCLAPTGRGKSNWLINVAAAAVTEGVPTLYVTLELSKEIIDTRFDSRLTNIPLNQLRGSPDEVRTAWRRLKKVVSKNLRTGYMVPGSTKVANIKQQVRALEHRGFSPRLVVVDYADLLRPRIEFQDSSYETQGQVYIDLIQFLGEGRYACWTATQGNRRSLSEDSAGELDMGMMADSVKKGFLADVVVGIAQGVKEKKFGKGRIVILKNRNGPDNKVIPVDIKHDVVTFKGR